MLGVTFAFLGDEIYIKAGVEVPSRRHYGNYPQIEDGVGMVRSFVTKFEKLLARAEPTASAVGRNGRHDERTHPFAVLPNAPFGATSEPLATAGGTGFGTMLTGEMFAPILREQVDRFNAKNGTRLHVLAVPNTYFGGDVSVAGLLTGQDLLAVRDQIIGDFVTIPKITIKSDEPIFLDGMTFGELQSKFSVPVIPVDIDFFSQRSN